MHKKGIVLILVLILGSFLTACASTKADRQNVFKSSTSVSGKISTSSQITEQSAVNSSFVQNRIKTSCKAASAAPISYAINFPANQIVKIVYSIGEPHSKRVYTITNSKIVKECTDCLNGKTYKEIKGSEMLNGYHCNISLFDINNNVLFSTGPYMYADGKYYAIDKDNATFEKIRQLLQNQPYSVNFTTKTASSRSTANQPNPSTDQ